MKRTTGDPPSFLACSGSHQQRATHLNGRLAYNFIIQPCRRPPWKGQTADRERSVDMFFGERISIQNFLRAGEIFIHEGNHYSPFELTLLQAMLNRLDTKVNQAKDTKAPAEHT